MPTLKVVSFAISFDSIRFDLHKYTSQFWRELRLYLCIVRLNSIAFHTCGIFVVCFFIKWFLLTGTNAALPNWTIDDLLQMNGNETKANTATATIATTPTKRTSLRTRTQQQMTETIGTSPTNHKRSSTLDSCINKRLKSNSTVSSFSQSSSSSGSKSNIAQQQLFSTLSQETVQQQKSPHLLQHLMAPSPDRVRKYNGPACKDTSNEKLCSEQQWTCNGSGYDETKNQSSSSVLKNLLVSGCDLSAGYVCHVPVRMRKLAKA